MTVDIIMLFTGSTNNPYPSSHASMAEQHPGMAPSLPQGGGA